MNTFYSNDVKGAQLFSKLSKENVYETARKRNSMLDTTEHIHSDSQCIVAAKLSISVLGKHT